MYKIGLVQTSDKIGKNVMLPLAIGTLWCYAQQTPTIRDRFCLVTTVYRKENIEQQAQQLSVCDVVCFSSYAWNLAYHLALAREVKQLNPQVYTVFGGPSMAPKNPAFWIENRNIVDIAIDGEGEPGIVSVLESFPNVTKTNVPGAYGLKHVNPLADRREQFSITDSPYVSGFYNHMIEEIHQRGEVAQAVIQTNRGCPYHCNFCEEGVDYKNKLYMYDLERVLAEIEWCAKNRVEYLNLADDNFGILPRDLDILKHAVALKLQHGYPKILDVTLAKNAPSRVLAMARHDVKHQTALLKSITMSLQSLHPVTLKAIKRFNMADVKLAKLAKELKDIGMMTYTELIWPLPYETYDTFCTGIDKSIEMHLDNWASIYALGALETNELTRIFESDIKVSQTVLPSTTSFDNRIKETITHIYETTWASHDDVVRGQVMYTWLSVLYYFGFARYLIEQSGLSPTTFVNHIIDYAEQHPDSVFGKWTTVLKTQWSARLRGLPLDDIGIFPEHDTTHWFYFTHLSSWINQDRDQFYQELRYASADLNINNIDDVFAILPHTVVQPEQSYPYSLGSARIELKDPTNPTLVNNYEYCHYYFFYKRKNGWHRTIYGL